MALPSQSIRAASSCLLELFNLDDRLIRHIDGEANSVAKLKSFQKAGWLRSIAHRHRFHEALNFAVLDDDLARAWHGGDNFALALTVCGASSALLRATAFR